MMKRFPLFFTNLCALMVLTVSAADVTEVTLTKPRMRWLWGGFGFHNSEATMLPLMSDEFRDQRVLKTFREIAPTYSRVFAGFADWTREAMDSFADYYDLTFRGAGTTIYMVPGRFPYVDREFDAKKHFEDIAKNCAYLVKERRLTKLRYYAVANELSAGNVYAWFSKAGKLDLYRDCCEEMYLAFRRHGLDIGLQTADASGTGIGISNTVWATRNVDEFTDTYCWHVYDGVHKPGDLGLYDFVYTNVAGLVRLAARREKRLSVGEYGFQGRSVRGNAMYDDGCYSFRNPEDEPRAAIARAEMGLAAMNAGAVSAVNWTMFDYPDPFLREDGDSAEEKVRYDVARYSGHGLQIRYNKCGLVRWNDDDRDYSARAALYTMGYLAKLFRKGARVLVPVFTDPELRVGAVTNPDGSCSVAVINWGAAKTVRIASAHPLATPLRVYEYDSAKPPYNAFNDLQAASGTVAATNNVFTATLPAKSMTFLTTDYADRTPPAVGGVELKDGVLSWTASADPAHVYYRVFRDGEQIASTVATWLDVKGAKGDYAVRSVDRWGNVGR